MFVCFPSRTRFSFKVSRYTCGYSFNFSVVDVFKSPYNLPHIFYPPYHLPLHVLFEFHFPFAVTSVTRSHYTCVRLRTWTFYWNKSVVLTNWSNFVMCTIFCYLIFLDDGLFSFFVLNRKTFWVATSSKHPLPGGWCFLLIYNFNSVPAMQIPTWQSSVAKHLL